MGKTKLDYLRKLPLFKLLTNEELNSVSDVAKEKEYKGGEVLFSEGQAGDVMFIITRGAVKIMQKNYKGLKDIITLSQGDFFGEIALFDNAGRSASAIFLEDSTLLEIARDDFANLISDKPHLGIKILYRIIQEMGRRLQRMNREERDI